MEVASKRSIDGEPHVTTNMFLAEKQVEKPGVVKKQKVETIDGKPHVTTLLILAEKQEVENAEKPHSKNKNEEIAKPEVEVAKVESPECSNEALEPCTVWQWSPCTGFEEAYEDETKYYESWGNLKVSANSKIGSESDNGSSDSDDDTSSEDE